MRTDYDSRLELTHRLDHPLTLLLRFTPIPFSDGQPLAPFADATVAEDRTCGFAPPSPCLHWANKSKLTCKLNPSIQCSTPTTMDQLTAERTTLHVVAMMHTGQPPPTYSIPSITTAIDNQQSPDVSGYFL